MEHDGLSPALRLGRRARAVAAKLGWRARPSFLIVGAQKAGTTALHEYLSNHSQLLRAKDKEVGIFCPEIVRNWHEHRHYALFSRLDRDGANPAVQREGREWYQMQFSLPRPWRRQQAFEATPEYLYYPQVPARIRAYRPDMKLIVLLRDPVARAFSAWNMYHRFDEPTYVELRDPRGFEEAIREELTAMDRPIESAGPGYVRRGLYHEQLSRFLEHFPREQILIMESRELKAHRLDALRRVCQFLGVEAFANEDHRPVVFAGNYTDKMPPVARDLLAEFYRPHNARLFDLIGETYDWTC